MKPALVTAVCVVLALAAPVVPFLARAPAAAGAAVAVATAPGAAPRRDTVGPALLPLALARTPFRVGGVPPAVRFGEAPLPVPVPRPVVERPRLVLTGILWSRQPVALLEGIPGTDQAQALVAGAQAGGLRVTRIEPSRVTVVGQDTVWTLEVRNPWP